MLSELSSVVSCILSCLKNMDDVYDVAINEITESSLVSKVLCGRKNYVDWRFMETL